MTHENDELRLLGRAERCADAAGKERKMLLKKLARAIACKHCENPSKLYELQIHADEQTREILRLNHVLDEVKKEREAARAAVDSWKRLYAGREEKLGMIDETLRRITKTNCSNCGNRYCMFRPEGNELRYNCHLWVPKEEEYEDHI